MPFTQEFINVLKNTHIKRLRELIITYLAALFTEKNGGEDADYYWYDGSVAHEIILMKTIEDTHALYNPDLVKKIELAKETIEKAFSSFKAIKPFLSINQAECFATAEELIDISKKIKAFETAMSCADKFTVLELIILRKSFLKRF
jgi:hypothetical protein